MCIAFLRVINNLNDSVNLYYLSSSDIYKMPLDDLSFCMNYARRTNYSLYYVLKNIENIKELESVSEKARKIARKLVKDIKDYLEYSRISTTGRLLYKFLTESNYLKTLVKEESLASEEKIKNIAKFFDMVRKFELVAREDRLIYFINHLDMLIDAGDDPATAEADLDESAVNVLTIHKAKGLEFPVVFLVSLVKGKFPWPKRGQMIAFPEELIKDIIPEGDFHIQEERRLFYVGMTRAKKELYLTSAVDYGTSRPREISPFIFEALGISKENTKAIKSGAEEAIARFAPVKESSKKRKKKIPADEILELSAYKIDDYLTCPLKYKYVHILRIPIMKHHTVLYGSAMHEAVENYYKFKMRKEKVSLGKLISWFEDTLTPHGFVTMEHFKERLERGKEMLGKFYQREEKLNIIPDSIEKEFSFMLDNNRIKGRWDRLDKEKDGIVIVDFKSSQADSQKEANKKTKESKQLSLYALACKETQGELPKRVELYFLESGLVGQAEKDEGDFEKLHSDIEEVSEGIRKQDFHARPTYNACSNCAFNQICPHTTYK
jgi:DNA helicase-2/ATP-dependent DNA helicase PcrA